MPHLANSTIKSKLTLQCRWEDDTGKEMVGQPPSNTESKEITALKMLHTGLLYVSQLSNAH